MYNNTFTRRAIAKGNRLARELSVTRATGDKASSDFWCLLSGSVLPVSISKKLYIKAGYKPFSGWPLTHS